MAPSKPPIQSIVQLKLLALPTAPDRGWHFQQTQSPLPKALPLNNVLYHFPNSPILNCHLKTKIACFRPLQYTFPVLWIMHFLPTFTRIPPGICIFVYCRLWHKVALITVCHGPEAGQGRLAGCSGEASTQGL